MSINIQRGAGSGLSGDGDGGRAEGGQQRRAAVRRADGNRDIAKNTNKHNKQRKCQNAFWAFPTVAK